MPIVNLMPEPYIQFFDATGNVPLAGGKLYAYAPGTTNLKNTYTDSTGNTANSNPVILDASGRASIWLSGVYDMVLQDSTSVIIWSQNNVSIGTSAADAENASISAASALTNANIASAASSSASASANAAANIAAGLANMAVLVTPHITTLSGDSAETVFALGVTPAGVDYVDVFISGVYQNKSGHSISTSNIVFVSPPTTGTNNIEVVTRPSMAATTFTAADLGTISASPVVFQLRRDTRTNCLAFAGASGEVLADTTLKTLRYQDGGTNGGFPFSVEHKFADITAASTIDLGSAIGSYGDITGNTTITALGTASAGTRRTVHFTGTPALTYNATSLILPAALSYQVVAGDIFEFTSLGSGNWICTNYALVSGSSISAAGKTLQSQTFNTSGTFTVPVGITEILVSGCGGGANGLQGSSGFGGGAGGASGCFVYRQTLTVTSGESVTVVIGAVGGGTTSVGTINILGASTLIGIAPFTRGMAGGAGGETGAGPGAGESTQQFAGGAAAPATSTLLGGGGGGAGPYGVGGAGNVGTGYAAAANTGAGGGGGGGYGGNYYGGNGGSGKVVIEWYA
jgi:hypothetical protein